MTGVQTCALPISEEFSLGLKFDKDSVFIKVKNSEFNKYFNEDYEEDSFEIRFIEENQLKVNPIKIEAGDKEVLDKLKELPMWDDYRTRCIGCGSCNMACMTCTSILTSTVVHNNKIEEVKRTWGGCQLVKTAALKNNSMSDIVPKRMKQRVLDKFYQPLLKNSKEQICVGCGRCIDVCPRYISFAHTVNLASSQLDKVYLELGRKIKE